MHIPLDSYLKGHQTEVFSLVVGVPFAPLDLDLAHLTRGEWSSLVDRFRVWYLPDEGDGGKPVCYLMIRKVSRADDVLVYGHIVVNLGGKNPATENGNLTVGILSNDEVRARAMLNSTLGIPPSFHRRTDLKLLESRWRSDPDATMRFLANLHSAVARTSPAPGVEAFALKLDAPPGIMGELKKGMGAWWKE